MKALALRSQHKLAKIIIRKENHCPINLFHKHTYKKTQQNINKSNPEKHRKIIQHGQMGFIPEMQCLFNIKKINQYNYHINGIMGKNVISIITGKSFDQI